jgi:hypothetical protein
MTLLCSERRKPDSFAALQNASKNKQMQEQRRQQQQIPSEMATKKQRRKCRSFDFAVRKVRERFRSA